MAVKGGSALVAGIGSADLVKILGKRAYTRGHTFIAEQSRSAHFGAGPTIYGVHHQLTNLKMPA